jgi:hypothetical protein
MLTYWNRISFGDTVPVAWNARANEAFDPLDTALRLTIGRLDRVATAPSPERLAQELKALVGVSQWLETERELRGATRAGVDRHGQTLALRALSRSFPAVHAAEEQLGAYLRTALLRLAELSAEIAAQPARDLTARRTVRGVRHVLAAERRRLKALRLGLVDTQPTRVH